MFLAAFLEPALVFNNGRILNKYYIKYLLYNMLKSRYTCQANCVSRDACQANCVSRDTW